MLIWKSCIGRQFMGKKKTEQEEIDEIIKKHKKQSVDSDYTVQYDESGNRYILYKGKWIG